MLGAGVTVEIAGQRWTFSPLTLGDEADLELELRALLGDKLDVVEQVRTVMDGFGPSERIEMVKWGLQEEMRLRRLGPIELAAEFRLPNVDRLVLRYQLRRHHPDVTDEQIGQLTSDFSARKALSMLVQQIREVLPKDLGPVLAALVAATGLAKREDAGPTSSGSSPSASAGP